MMRIDLLRSLPPSPDATPPPKPPSGGALKSLGLVVLVLVLAGSAILVAKPEWVPASWVTTWRSVMQGGVVTEQAHADSLRRAQAVAVQASHQIEARQTAVIEWLYQLELLRPAPPSPSPSHRSLRGGTRDPFSSDAPVSFTTSTFTASGEFLLEGRAASAEALSALQEALVLIPGMDLRESDASEVAGSRDPAFDFRFAGSLAAPLSGGGDVSEGVSENKGDTGEGTENPDGIGEALESAGAAAVRNRVGEAATLSAELDSFLRTAAERGLDFAPPPEARVARAGSLRAHAWLLRGEMTVRSPADSSAPAALTSLRELLEHERHRGSPFAIQRITVSERRGQLMVFLDILALTH